VRGVLLVVDSEGVDGLVDERPQPRVGRERFASMTILLCLGSHQPLALPAIGSNETL